MNSPYYPSITCHSQERLITGFQFARYRSTIISKPSTIRENLQFHVLQNPGRIGHNFGSLVLSTATVDSSLSPELNTIVFVIGLVPFLWATIEFWRRIAVGEPFGTGKDSVIIGEDLKPLSSRGRRTLGRGALVTAYVLFGIAIFTVAITIYSVLSTGI